MSESPTNSIAVMAGIPVRDLAASTRWYSNWIGRAPDATPRDDLAEWQLCAGGMIQLIADAERAGRSIVRIRVDDLDKQIAALREADVQQGELEVVADIVRVWHVLDPDGNYLSFYEE